VDTKEYINSGILERYVLGDTSVQERQEVECLSSIYPEVQKELEEMRSSLEAMALRLKTPVPDQVKSKIIEAIRDTPQSSNEDQASSSKTPVRSINGGERVMKYAVYAAAVLVLVFFAQGYFSSRQKAEQLQADLEETKQDLHREFEKEKLQMEQDVFQNQRLSAFALNEKTNTHVLDGTALVPEAKVRILWNDEEQQIVLIADQLPQLEEGKQYQLWAISDGKPLSLALLDARPDFSEPLDIEPTQIEAFAITIENTGGSEAPTLDQMVVIGNT
jgi:anti-sigma-K factor RskA